MKNFYKPATILIVDDNQNQLKVLHKAIIDSGWEILVATDGESAIEQAEYGQPDLILLDVMMTGLDGFETCQQLKTNLRTCEIPIIFMTALCDAIDKVKGLSIGGVDYITKPFYTEEVLARINIHLKLYTLSKQLEDQKNYLSKHISELTNELSHALHELQQSQIQLIRSEKMSTLGQLVATVAHEINNPVGFITGNLCQLSEYTSKLINHLEIYRRIYPNPPDEIVKNAASIYLDELVKDIPDVIASMEVGIDRICNMSSSLRNFSRSDISNQVEFNINEGIESTLMILKPRLKANNQRPEIEVVKEYGDLPLIKCYPGQLNQVFMNIISNAIDALEELTDAKHPKTMRIRISTQINSKCDRVIISIADNGQGISIDTQEKVFAQFFTTKSVGKGTGLGLSISRQIIEEKHHGKISCKSSPGEGAEFIMEIPFKYTSDYK